VANLLRRKHFAAEALHHAFEGARAIFVNFGNNHSAAWTDFAGDVVGKLCEITLNSEIGGIADQRSAGSGPAGNPASAPIRAPAAVRPRPSLVISCTESLP
jgi:hypothetical protein